MNPKRLARHLFEIHESLRFRHLSPSNSRHREIVRTFRDVTKNRNGILNLGLAGRSLEGREILHVRCGTGPRKILLWSQMHGNESTATLAMLDIFRFLSDRRSEVSGFDRILGQVTIHAIPMLNPDGAEKTCRHTALGIDMNRDARRIITPEAAILRKIHRDVRPGFGFNLHDQELSTVGDTSRIAAIALLAPAADRARSRPPVRRDAMKAAALIASTLSQFARGHIASYDDGFEPRAFGDRMQAWGTSTVLIESGHWPGDPEKHFVRKLNFVALLVSIAGIADGTFRRAPLSEYDSLKANGKRAFDILLRRVMLTHPSGWSEMVDIGLQASRGAGPIQWRTVIPKEIGDLSGFGGLFQVDCRKRGLQAGTLKIDRPTGFGALCDLLHIKAPWKLG